MIADPGTLTIIERLREQSPGALLLATYASPAIHIEPALVRALRYELAPHLEVGVEADLWHSRLVEARSHEAMSLRPRVANVLRERLRDDVERPIARRAWQIVQQVHANVSPAIAHEEALAWFAIDGQHADIEQALKSALRTMAEQPERGLANWWMRARERLPEVVRTSHLAASLDRRALLMQGGETNSLAGDLDARQQQLVASAQDRLIYVRRGHSALQIGDFEPDANTVAIRVPDLPRVRVAVDSQGSEPPVMLALRPGDAQIVPFDTAMVQLKTERGDVYELRRDAVDPTRADMLLLGELLEAVGKGLGRERPDLLLPGADNVSRFIRDFVDPPWQRGLRQFAATLNLTVDSRFSQFGDASITVAMERHAAAFASAAENLQDLRREIADRLPLYDHWEPASLELPESQWSETRELVAEFNRSFRAAVPAGDPLRASVDWIEAHISPSWLRMQTPAGVPLSSEQRSGDEAEGLLTLPDLIGRLGRVWAEAALTNDGGLTSNDDRATKPVPKSKRAKSQRPPRKLAKAIAISDSIGSDALAYLRRNFSDSAFSVRPGSGGFVLRGAWPEVAMLSRMLGDGLVHGIKAQMEQRDQRRRSRLAEVTVAADGSGDFDSIHRAISAAGENATIHVSAGEYIESVALLAGQKLLGPENGEAIVDANGQGFVIGAANGCEIRRLTVRNGGSKTGVHDCGIMVGDCANVVIAQCRVSDNGHYGVILQRCSAVSLEQCFIARNKLLAIYIADEVTADIRFNRIVDHAGPALAIAQEAAIRFANNTVVRCESGVFPRVKGGRPLDVTVTNTIFAGNAYAIDAAEGVVATIEHNLFFENREDYVDRSNKRSLQLPDSNLFSDPLFVDAARSDFRLSADSPARGAGRDGDATGENTAAIDIGALQYVPPDANPLPDRQSIRVIVNDESVDPQWPRQLQQQIAQAGYQSPPPEQWIYAKERGDPSLRSFAQGNSIHFHRDARAAAERLRDDLADHVALKLVAHGNNDEMFAGSIWGFDTNEMYVFLVNSPAVWQHAVLDLSGYAQQALDTESDPVAYEVLAAADADFRCEGAATRERVVQWLEEIYANSRRLRTDDNIRKLGLVIFVAGMTIEAPRIKLVLPAIGKQSVPAATLDIPELVDALATAFDHVLVVVDRSQTPVNPGRPQRKTLVPRLESSARSQDERGDTALVYGEEPTHGRLAQYVLNTLSTDERAGPSGKNVSDIATAFEKSEGQRLVVEYNGARFLVPRRPAQKGKKAPSLR